MTARSRSFSYMLTRKQKRAYANVSKVKIAIWGQVPEALDRLIKLGGYGETRAEVYYNLAMTQLRELEKKDPRR